MKNIGTIFNIQKYSIHDGGGIRTLVFMKGCPLRCIWCSNPESQKSKLEIMNVSINCIRCGKCIDVCEQGAIAANDFSIDRKKCIGCGKCAIVCYANSKTVVGKNIEIDELLRIIEKDRIFYKNSEGGVTVGGGEPLLQSDFVGAFFKECSKMHINTAIETCGYGQWEKVKEVFDYVDFVFYDLKHMDNETHRRLTGVENDLILENAKKIAQMGKEITFRLPLVENYTDGDNVIRTAKFVELLGNKERINFELLPFHNFGAGKYQWLDLEYTLNSQEQLKNEQLEEYYDLLSKVNINVIKR